MGGFCGNSCGTGDGVQAVAVQAVTARKEHKCTECGGKIAVGDWFLNGMWGSIQQGGGCGGAVRQCGFCAALFETFDCVAYGELKDHIEYLFEDKSDAELIGFFGKDLLSEIARRFAIDLEKRQK